MAASVHWGLMVLANEIMPRHVPLTTVVHPAPASGDELRKLRNGDARKVPSPPHKRYLIDIISRHRTSLNTGLISNHQSTWRAYLHIISWTCYAPSTWRLSIVGRYGDAIVFFAFAICSCCTLPPTRQIKSSVDVDMTCKL